LRGRTVTVHDWDSLMRAGEFDPGYLHVGRGSDVDGHPRHFVRQPEPRTVPSPALSQEHAASL
jgi:hypothetical protein